MPYINLQEAANITGKSVRTIRRLCNSPENKNYIAYENGRLMVEVSFLDSHYPMVNEPNSVLIPNNDKGQTNATDSHKNVPNGNIKNSDKLLHEIEILKLELKYLDQINQQKDKQIELLERSLLLLGEGVKKEPDKRDSPSEENEPKIKKRQWWQW